MDSDNKSSEMDWDAYLRVACFTEDFEQIKFAIEQGGDPNVEIYDDGSTILYWAVWSGWKNLVELLLNAGATASKADNLGSTALHLAAEHSELEIAKLLLEADGVLAVDLFDYVQHTPLMWAVDKGNLEIARLLIQAGSDINAHEEAKVGDTALYIAASHGNSEMVKLLLDAGADPLIPAWMGQTPWDKAKDRRSAEGLKVRELVAKAVPESMRQETKPRKRKK